jgi:DnaJ-class molecular chaperone
VKTYDPSDVRVDPLVKTYYPSDVRVVFNGVEIKPCKALFLTCDCPVCNGSGTVGAFLPRACDRCEGSGLVATPDLEPKP